LFCDEIKLALIWFGNFETKIVQIVKMELQNATSRTRVLAGTSKGFGPGLSVRPGNRVPLGEISVNNAKAGQIQQTSKPQKNQVHVITLQSSFEISHGKFIDIFVCKGPTSRVS